MPKLKTKGSMKGRFKSTASGKFLRTFAGKRHGMTKRNSRMLRQARGTTVVSKTDEKRIRRFAPYI